VSLENNVSLCNNAMSLCNIMDSSTIPGVNYRDSSNLQSWSNNSNTGLYNPVANTIGFFATGTR
jgi:hypothetical protein